MPTSSTDVLVVDDDDSIRSVLGDALDDAGYRVRTAATTDDALRAVEERAPSAIVLDLRMPDDGPAFRAELLRRSCRSAIVAMSASIDGQRWAHSMDVPFVAKPFLLDDLIAALDSALRTR